MFDDAIFNVAILAARATDHIKRNGTGGIAIEPVDRTAAQQDVIAHRPVIDAGVECIASVNGTNVHADEIKVAAIDDRDPRQDDRSRIVSGLDDDGMLERA